MLESNQKVKQIKNVAVAVVQDEEGRILLVKDPIDQDLDYKDSDWMFPASTLIPGATYTETFASHVLESTGCIIEATSLVASEKRDAKGLHLEYVSCKIVCREKDIRVTKNSSFLWVHPSKIKSHLPKKIHKDLLDFLGV